MGKLIASRKQLVTWLEISESYWSQFVWSPYHPNYHECKKPDYSNHISLMQVDA